MIVIIFRFVLHVLDKGHRIHLSRFRANKRAQTRKQFQQMNRLAPALTALPTRKKTTQERRCRTKPREDQIPGGNKWSRGDKKA